MIDGMNLLPIGSSTRCDVITPRARGWHHVTARFAGLLASLLRHQLLDGFERGCSSILPYESEGG